MRVVEHFAFVGGALPEQFSIAGIVGENLERVLAIAAHAIGMDEGLAFELVLYGRGAGNDVAFEIGGEKDTIAPDDGRRVAAAGHVGLPRDAALGAPRGRQGSQRGDAVGGAAPARPYVGRLGECGGGKDQEGRKSVHGRSWCMTYAESVCET